jgi:nucleotide-binding universal stress UspA family protein
MKSRAPDIPLTFRVVHGNTANTILNVAHEVKAELIAIASHRHTHFQLQLHGSTTEALLRLSDCPVLVLRQPINPDSRHTGADFSNRGNSTEAK